MPEVSIFSRQGCGFEAGGGNGGGSGSGTTAGGSSGGGGGTGGSPLLTVDGGTGGCSWSDGVTGGLLRGWLLLYASHSGALVPVNVALFSDSTPLFPLLRPIFPTLKKVGLTATTGPGWLLAT